MRIFFVIWGVKLCFVKFLVGVVEDFIKYWILLDKLVLLILFVIVRLMVLLLFVGWFVFDIVSFIKVYFVV